MVPGRLFLSRMLPGSRLTAADDFGRVSSRGGEDEPMHVTRVHSPNGLRTPVWSPTVLIFAILRALIVLTTVHEDQECSRAG